MKNWRGIATDIAAVSDGALMIRNASFDIEGEFRRRIALEKITATAGALGMTTYGAPNGTNYIVLNTSTGTVEVIST